MVAYHSFNVILVQLFTSRKDFHRLNAYNIIMQRLKDKDPLVDLQILENECGKEYKKLTREKCGGHLPARPSRHAQQERSGEGHTHIRGPFLSYLGGGR